MGLFRLIFSALFSSQSPSRYRIVTEERNAGSLSSLDTTRRVTYARRNDVRALADSAAPQTRRVTILGRCFVIDGDTIMIGDARIRLAGIDAAELDHPYGKRAKWALITLCKGHDIHAVLEAALSHDRMVATCYLPDGRDLSAEMVKLGMAVDWPKFSGGKYQQYERPEVRRLLWRSDSRQKGRMPPPAPR